MKHLMIPVFLAAALIALCPLEASAVVCARGVLRAGCVAAGGGAAVGIAPVAAPSGAVVAPRCAVARRTGFSAAPHPLWNCFRAGVGGLADGMWPETRCDVS